MDNQEPVRYFIGIVPPVSICKQIEAFKKNVAEEYQSVAALRSPAHITMHMPFLWKQKKEEFLISTLENFCKSRQRFTIELNGFGCFPPRVIFVNVAPSVALTNLEIEVVRTSRQALNLSNARYKEFPFHPHMTIAFRDLKKSVFKSAWEFFQQQTFVERFEVDSLTLLKHDGKEWEEYKTISFQ